jgi:hypothetical protein
MNPKTNLGVSAKCNSAKQGFPNLLSETVLDEPENDCENELFSQQNIVNFDSKVKF